jgi:hypothetical protein
VKQDGEKRETAGSKRDALAASLEAVEENCRWRLKCQLDYDA